MEPRRNVFKAALAAGHLRIGLWSSLCSSIAAEIIGDSGCDWILFDLMKGLDVFSGAFKDMRTVQN